MTILEYCNSLGPRSKVVFNLNTLQLAYSQLWRLEIAELVTVGEVELVTVGEVSRYSKCAGLAPREPVAKRKGVRGSSSSCLTDAWAISARFCFCKNNKRTIIIMSGVYRVPYIRKHML